ncbi:hypothetical protein [Myroides odoratus]|uniref:hypothetical protein n=1 Tax=Myroides odoratus TaxID=256 RepID=UPI0039AFA5C0
MKKTVFLLLLTSTLALGQTKKDNYIKEHFPLLIENLSSEELKDFKKTMKLNSKNKLTYLNGDLLQKGSGNQFGAYYQIFAFDLSGVKQTVTIIGSDNREIVIEADGTISFDNTRTGNAEAEDTTTTEFESFSGERYNVADIMNWDGVFVITSTTCGPCMQAYAELNALATDPAYEKVIFTALFINPASNLQTYTEGSTYKNFGLLENPWKLFTSQDLIAHLAPTYNLKNKLVPYVFIKKDNKIIYSSDRGIKIDHIKEKL